MSEAEIDRREEGQKAESATQEQSTSGYPTEVECSQWAYDDQGGQALHKSVGEILHRIRIDQPEVFDAVFHENMQKILTTLTYDFDYVQPLGLNTPLAQTMVKRVLVGQEGTTYKYLGIRMFSIPFGEEMKLCNSMLSKRTRELTKSEGDEEYNLKY